MSISLASSGTASTTFFLAEPRFFSYSFLTVPCSLLAARASVTVSRSSATSSERAIRNSGKVPLAPAFHLSW
ncbi:MAG: hypothetical protein IPH80_14475 [Myxococcales bacterium]|nr:hypothetical protein [Myxococcales bacterium]